MARYVTKTGRTLRVGRTTRRSLAVGKPKGIKPLPLHLQCHPQALHRTPMHPDCRTFTPLEIYQRVKGASFGPDWRIRAMRGDGLSSTMDRVRVVVDDCGTWYCADTAYALWWARAARVVALTVNVYL